MFVCMYEVQTRVLSSQVKKLKISLENLHKGNIKILCKITCSREEFNLMCKFAVGENDPKKDD